MLRGSNHAISDTSAKLLEHSTSEFSNVAALDSLLGRKTDPPLHNSTRSSLFLTKHFASEDVLDARRELFSTPTALPTATIFCQMGDEDKDVGLGCDFDDLSDNNGYCLYLQHYFVIYFSCLKVSYFFRSILFFRDNSSTGA
jgi:hypothetical protein